MLNAEDRGCGVKIGDVMPYAESLCAQRIECNAPSIEPDVEQIEVYCNAPARKRAPIGAYVSFPLQRDDGTLFGRLCAIHPQRCDATLLREEALIGLLARQLATVLHFDLARNDAWQLALRRETDAMTDALCGVLNRRGWDHRRRASDCTGELPPQPAIVDGCKIRSSRRVTASVHSAC